MADLITVNTNLLVRIIVTITCLISNELVLAQGSFDWHEHIQSVNNSNN